MGASRLLVMAYPFEGAFSSVSVAVQHCKIVLPNKKTGMETMDNDRRKFLKSSAAGVVAGGLLSTSARDAFAQAKSAAPPPASRPSWKPPRT